MNDFSRLRSKKRAPKAVRLMIYFASDRPTGLGFKDIYRSVLQ